MKQGDTVRLVKNPGWSDQWTQGKEYILLGDPVHLPQYHSSLTIIVENDEFEIDTLSVNDVELVTSKKP